MDYIPMTAEHTSRIARLEKRCFSHPWSEESLIEQLSLNNTIYIAALELNEVIGYVGSYLAADTLYINNLAVAPDYRKQGIGSGLIGALKAKAREINAAEMTLEVRAQNAAAISLYKKAGFNETGIRKKYYTDPDDDAIIMHCTV